MDMAPHEPPQSPPIFQFSLNNLWCPERVAHSTFHDLHSNPTVWALYMKGYQDGWRDRVSENPREIQIPHPILAAYHAHHFYIPPEHFQQEEFQLHVVQRRRSGVNEEPRNSGRECPRPDTTTRRRRASSTQCVDEPRPWSVGTQARVTGPTPPRPPPAPTPMPTENALTSK